jgi:tetratricopeptide (TPR) repeat protein
MMNDEHNRDYYNDKGIEYYKADNYIAALAFFEQSRKLGEKNIGILEYIADTYKEIEEYEKSLEVHNEVIAELEQNPFIKDDGKPLQFYNDRAFVYIAMEKYDEAIEDFTRAIEMESGRASFFNGRAQAYYHTEKYAEALLDMSKALYLDDGVSWYWERRATIFSQLRIHDQADYDIFRAYLCLCTPTDDDDEDVKPMEDNIIFTENNFKIEQNKKGEIVFHLNNREKMPALPEVFYDGKNNALFRRRFDQFVFLENIPADMREALHNAENIFVTETIIVDDEGIPVSEDEYNTLYYKVKVRKYAVNDSLVSIDAIKEDGYFFFAYLASRIRAKPNKPVNEIIGIEDYVNLAAVLALEEDYEMLQHFHDTIIEGDEGDATFANLALNKKISATFRNWQPTPLYLITTKKRWSALKDGVNMIRFLASFEGFDPNVPSGEGETPLYNQCLNWWQLEILQTLLEIGADPNQDCEMGDACIRVFLMALFPEDFDGETSIFTPLNEKQFERIKLLIDYGADVTYSFFSSGETALSLVIAYSEGEIREELVQLCMSKGADIKEAIKGIKRGLENWNAVYQKALDDLHTLSIFTEKSLNVLLQQIDDELCEEIDQEQEE